MSAIKNLLDDIFVLFDEGYEDEQIAQILDIDLSMVEDARDLYEGEE
jgi:ferredoxin-fold anticodon binding domain-containing protein